MATRGLVKKNARARPAMARIIRIITRTRFFTA